MKWIKLSRSLSDVSRHPPLFLGTGVELTSLSASGDTFAHRRFTYELNETCSADIPDRAAFFGFEEYQSLRFDAEAARPDGMILAFGRPRHPEIHRTLSGDLPTRRGQAFVEMTGVLAAHRRHGIASAMKRQVLAVAASRGMLHHSDPPPSAERRDHRR